jgi:hypothetical protein
VEKPLPPRFTRRFVNYPKYASLASIDGLDGHVACVNYLLQEKAELNDGIKERNNLSTPMTGFRHLPGALISFELLASLIIHGAVLHPAYCFEGGLDKGINSKSLEAIATKVLTSPIAQKQFFKVALMTSAFCGSQKLFDDLRHSKPDVLTEKDVLEAVELSRGKVSLAPYDTPEPTGCVIM